MKKEEKKVEELKEPEKTYYPFEKHSHNTI